MEFLKEILGDEIYKQIESKLNEYNGNEANKDKQVKLGNLGGGEYVGKGKFDSLNEQLTGKQTELDTANGLIAELKKGNKDNEELQGKISAYETQVAELQTQLQETKRDYVLDVKLMDAGVKDEKMRKFLRYELTSAAKEDGESLELDENDNIKGWDAQLSGLKTQFPTMFEAASGGDGGGDGFKPLDNKGLPKGGGEKVVTKEQFLAMNYEERVKLKQENEQLFKKLAH